MNSNGPTENDSSVGCIVISVIHVAIVLSHKKECCIFINLLTVAERIRWVNSQLLSYIIVLFFLLLFGSLYYIFWYYLELLLFATLYLLHIEIN